MDETKKEGEKTSESQGRADFTASTKRKLFERVGGYCSYPGCGRITSGPSNEGDSKVSKIAQACHIVAAATGKGARRVNKNMSDEERKSIGNGIWMCYTHGTLIDTDEVKYTVELLKRFKIIAEKVASIRLATSRYSYFEALELIDTNDVEQFIIETTTNTQTADVGFARYDFDYIGREADKQELITFFTDPNQHFMLLYGVGGMGKSHLIAACRNELPNFKAIYYECTKTFTLKSLFAICEIDYPTDIIDIDVIKHQFFNAFKEKRLQLILDDFYEVVDTDVRGLLLNFARLSHGKFLLVSRVNSQELLESRFAYKYHELPPLPRAEFFILLKRMAIRIAQGLTLQQSHLLSIYKKTGGYPLAAWFVLQIANIGERVENILENIAAFDKDEDPEGRKFSQCLFNNLFINKELKKELKLLCAFSAFYGNINYETIKKLPEFNFILFKNLSQKRGFIVKDTNGLYHCHALIKTFAYDELNNKKETHLSIAKIFEKQLLQAPQINGVLLENCVQHYTDAGDNTLLKQLSYQLGQTHQKLILYKSRNLQRKKCKHL